MALFALALLLPAGTFRWPRAWVFLGVALVAAIWSTVAVARAGGGLLEERFKPPVQKGQPLADKVLVLLLIGSFFGLIVFIALDVFRFHLLPGPPSWLSLAGLALFATGWWIATLALCENAFAAPVVKHQTERAHRVVDTGVYSVVRHPMYAGAVLLIVGMPLWLESSAGALLASVPIAVIVLRILVEERVLRRELPGYDGYTERVRYRIVPFVW